MFLKQGGSGVDGTQAHLGGVKRRPVAIHDPSQNRQLITLHGLFTGQKEQGRAVGHLGAVAGGHLPYSLVEDRLEFGEGLRARVAPQTIVLVIKTSVAVIERFNLGKKFLVLALGQAEVALHGKAVHFPAGDSEAVGQDLGGLSHRKPHEGIGQSLQ